MLTGLLSLQFLFAVVPQIFYKRRIAGINFMRIIIPGGNISLGTIICYESSGQNCMHCE
jgi:hypothetical protein